VVRMAIKKNWGKKQQTKGRGGGRRKSRENKKRGLIKKDVQSLGKDKHDEHEQKKKKGNSNGGNLWGRAPWKACVKQKRKKTEGILSRASRLGGEKNDARPKVKEK